MSFLDSVGNFFGSVKCGLNYHNWGPWTKKTAGSCVQSHTCTRCGETKSETNHDWPTWRYVEPGKCLQSHTCTHCGKSETQVVHSWEAWEYTSPRSCSQLRFCRRCERKEERHPTVKDHDYGDPQRISCGHLVYVCKRCKYEGHVHAKLDSEYHHRYGQWRSVGHSEERTCVDCGHRERR